MTAPLVKQLAARCTAVMSALKLLHNQAQHSLQHSSAHFISSSQMRLFTANKANCPPPQHNLFYVLRPSGKLGFVPAGRISIAFYMKKYSISDNYMLMHLYMMVNFSI
jgi:hypothetical protein